MANRSDILRVDEGCVWFDQSTNIVQSAMAYLRGESSNKIRAVDGVDLRLKRGEVQGVIGESGCGKTTLLLALVGMEDLSDGDVTFEGESLSEFSKRDWKEYRRRVQMIFQNPYDSLNPRMTVKETLEEQLAIHDISADDDRITEVLSQVELNPPEEYLHKNPGQLSGGEKQRVSIGRALILNPDIILADEPVSMLDVSTQASILKLLNNLTDELDVSMLYISHDISTVSYVCDSINVMYLGRIIESSPTRELTHNPKHPYTQALIQAVPIPNPHHVRQRVNLEGQPGDAISIPSGCRFKDRCPERMDICDVQPEFTDVDESHSVACHLYYDHETGS